MITASRHHDFSCGHRVHGQGSKCESLHGHNYRVHFECNADELDPVGRVIDFSVIKDKLCSWLEMFWDHKFLIWANDPWAIPLRNVDSSGVVLVPFNPTAENMAFHLLAVVGPLRLKGTGVTLIKVVIEETRKCQATASL